jgi:hypothetical protein
MAFNAKHPMRYVRELSCFGHEKKGPRRQPCHNPVPKDSFDLESEPTQENIKPVRIKKRDTFAPVPTRHEPELRNKVNGDNAKYYHRDLQDADDLRLLRIEPGTGHEPLRGTLQYTSMEDANLEPYDALSYCWGTQKDFLDITVNGENGFTVSKHLYAALLRLRRADQPRLMWIDVICVNQNNIPERNRSVSLIWKIYEKARRVIVWIGETDPDALNCPRRFPNTEDRDTRLALCCKPRLAALEHGNVKAQFDHLLKEMEMETTRKGRGEVWWKRLWVVQEFACAWTPPTVYFGPHAISWDFFSQLMRTPYHDRLSLFQSLRGQGDQTLMRLIFLSKDLYCSDPKDRIYALLGLSKEITSPIVPDYNKSVREVYEEATLHLIHEEGNLDVLSDHRPSRMHPEFPTWVPDFATLRERSEVRTVDSFAAGDAEEAVTPDVEFMDRPDEDSEKPSRMLRMKALFFDRIVSCTTESSLLFPDPAHRGILLRIAKPQQKTDTLSEPLQFVESLLEHLKVDYTRPTLYDLDRAPSLGYLMLEYLSGSTRSVVADLERATAKAPKQAKLEKEQFHGIKLTDAMRADLKVAAACESAFLWTRRQGSYSPDEAWNRLWTEQPYPQVSVKNRKRDFFATASGFIGMGPEGLQAGDEVVVPFGSSRPFILRKSKLGSHCVLVGDAVVPGIMSGQLLNLHKDGKVEAKDYFLK